MKPRRKKCRACREWFHPWNTLQRACSPPCALVVADQDKKKARRKRDRATKEKLKTRSDWMKESQRAFNAYIRHRDEGKPCISCGTLNPTPSRGGSWDCGHYRSTGAAPELRFEELNAHRQCKQCNSHLSGNVVEYRLRLAERIGQENLDWLEGPHEPKKYTIEELREIRDHYRAKVREGA